VVGGRLQRPFLGGAFLRTSASPGGGATTALPLHGIFSWGLAIYSRTRIRLVALIALLLHGIFFVGVATVIFRVSDLESWLLLQVILQLICYIAYRIAILKIDINFVSTERHRRIRNH